MDRSNQRLSFLNTSSEFLIFNLYEPLLLFLLRVFFSERPLKLVESGVSRVSIQRGFFFSKNSFEHMLVLELNVELSQMRFMLVGWFDVMIVDCIAEIFRQLMVNF